MTPERLAQIRDRVRAGRVINRDGADLLREVDRLCMSSVIKGACPGCGAWGSLVAEEGRITCWEQDCPRPSVVSDLLDRPNYHVLEVGEDGWGLQHAITCFPNLLDCSLHGQVEDGLARLQPSPGRYFVEWSDEDGVLDLVPEE